MENWHPKLEDIEQEENAKKEVAKSWSTWIPSLFNSEAVVTPEEKKKKINERIGRVHAKSIKQHACVLTQEKPNEYERDLYAQKERLRAEDSKDDAMILHLEQLLKIKEEKDQAHSQRAQWE